MKYTLVALCALIAVAAAASDVGQFLPKAIFTLDSEGHQSNLRPVGERLLRRLRRQVTFSSSSSSSTSSTGDGTTFSTSSHHVQNPDGSSVSGGTIQQFQQPAVGVSLDSRFGEDSASGTTLRPFRRPIGTLITFSDHKDANGYNQHFESHRQQDSNGNWHNVRPSTTTTSNTYKNN